MKRLIEETVFSGFVTAWFFAGCPTSCSPPSVKATTEGVVRWPSAFWMTTGWEPSMTATQELVVPRSMPMILPMRLTPRAASAGVSGGGRRGGRLAAGTCTLTFAGRSTRSCR